mmetsp:Transcript_10128/g.19548  ORF Transcript_10128/g.19548 Transcript_10128/m.19548 type:complete len:397 (-) Transcript_10128:365-1555(-)
MSITAAATARICASQGVPATTRLFPSCVAPIAPVSARETSQVRTCRCCAICRSLQLSGRNSCTESSLFSHASAPPAMFALATMEGPREDGRFCAGCRPLLLLQLSGRHSSTGSSSLSSARVATAGLATTAVDVPCGAHERGETSVGTANGSVAVAVVAAAAAAAAAAAFAVSAETAADAAAAEAPAATSKAREASQAGGLTRICRGLVLAVRRFGAIKRLEVCKSLLLRRITSFATPSCPTTSALNAAGRTFGWEWRRCCGCATEPPRLLWLADGLNHDEPAFCVEQRAVCNDGSLDAAPMTAHGCGRKVKTAGRRDSLDARKPPVASTGLIDRARGPMLAGAAMDIATCSMPFGLHLGVGNRVFSCRDADIDESMESPYGVPAINLDPKFWGNIA